MSMFVTRERAEVLAALDEWTKKYPDVEPVVYWETDDSEEIEVIWQKAGTPERVSVEIDKATGDVKWYYCDGKGFE